MVKAVFFDIDGTLVSFNTHKISENSKKALKELKSKGIKVFIASGRALFQLDNLENLEFDGYIMINGCNCFINENGSLKEIYKISEIIGIKEKKDFNLNKNVFLSFNEPNMFIEFNNNIKLNNTMTDFEGSGYDNIYNITYYLDENSNKHLNKKCTFIPCKDILTSSNGFAALYDKRDINFEAVYYNIIKKTELPKLRELDDDLLEIAKKIENAIGGKTIYKNNNFFIDYKNIGEVSFDMVAEGHKKLALIYILIMNGEIDKNTILLLDEPESNLNPSLTDLLVNILLSLSQLGLQIFIATHNSFILDDIELQRTDEDSVMYHSFYFDENDFNSGVQIESKEILLDLENNPINEKIIKQHNEYIEEMIK